MAKQTATVKLPPKPSGTLPNLPPIIENSEENEAAEIQEIVQNVVKVSSSKKQQIAEGSEVQVLEAEQPRSRMWVIMSVWWFK